MKRILLLTHLDRQSGREIIQGVTHYARIYGRWTFYHSIPFYQLPPSTDSALLSSKKLRSNIRQMMEEGQVDGLIAEIPNRQIAAEIIPESFPAVVIPLEEQIPGRVNLFGSQAHVGVMAAEFFLGLGFRHFSFVGYTPSCWSECRQAAFQKRLGEAGIQPYLFHQRQMNTAIRWQQDLDDIVEWIRFLPRPLAVWAWNDDLGEIILEACRLLEIVVPHEVSVLGADNDELRCNLCTPSLSSITFNLDSAGYAAAESLDAQMKGQAVLNAEIPLEPIAVIRRQSTDILAIDDPDIARIVQFIHQNAHRPIQVRDVLNQIPLSRSVIYERFRQVMGCSIYEEIKRVRIDTIARALATTSTPIKTIARKLGFSCDDHLSRYFRSIKKISPQTYRKRYGDINSTKPE